MHCYSQFRPLWHYSAGDTCLYSWWLALFKTPHLTPAPRSKCSRCSTVTGWFRESHSALGSISLATAADNYILLKNLGECEKTAPLIFLPSRTFSSAKKGASNSNESSAAAKKAIMMSPKVIHSCNQIFIIVQNE